MNQQQQLAIEYLRDENTVLREQLGRRRLRLNDDQRRRLAVKAKGPGRRALSQLATIVTPGTLLAWHRKLIEQKVRWDSEARPRAASHGQPDRIFGHSQAEENRNWGYRADPGRTLEPGIPDRARHGYQHSRKTRHLTGPRAGAQTTWREFLNRHWEQIGAVDFFTIEVWTRRGLIVNATIRGSVIV